MTGINDPVDLATLLTPDGVLGPTDLLEVDSAAGPGTQATPATALAAGGSQSSAQQIENAWSDAHPGGQATGAAEGNAIDLWNFDVARADLKPEHLRALEQFIKLSRMQPELVTAIATGYASSTGSGQANFRLATQRAQAVADWCDQNGLPGVIVSNGGIPPGDDGESFARARSVHLEVTGPPPPPAVTPLWKVLPGKAAAPPVTAQCGVKNTIDVDGGPWTFYSLPPNGWLMGDFSFTGKIRFKFEDPRACVAAQESISALSPAGSIKITGQVTDDLALRVSVSRQWDKAATAALTALVGEGGWEWEIGLQTQANFLVLKTPTFSLTEMVGGPQKLVQFTWDGAKVTVQIAGQFQFAGGPGPLLIEPLAEWAAGLEIGAVEGAALIGALATCAAIFYLTIDAAVNADAEGLRRAGLVAQRMGFAAQLAVIITTGAADQDADQFLSGWDEPRLSQIRNVVDQARRDAVAQVDALGDQKDARVSALRGKYAQDQSGGPLRYNTVAAALYAAAGGAATGGPASLNQL